MKKVFSVIWKVIAVAMILVGVYLLIQVMGDAEGVIDSYKQLTGNSIGATNSIKISFLREYVKHTGDRDILVTLGVTPDEAELILEEDIEPPEPTDPEDDRQKPGKEPEPTPEPKPPEPAPGEFEIDYMPFDPDGFMSQGHAVYYQIDAADGTTLGKKGCAIFALYNAYRAHGGTERIEDILLKYSKEKLSVPLTIDPAGHLKGYIGEVGAGYPLWNWIKANYYDPGSEDYRDENCARTVDDVVTEDGEYIIYYSHGGKDDTKHWVYTVRSGGAFKVANPGEEDNNIGGKRIRSVYKLS